MAILFDAIAFLVIWLLFFCANYFRGALLSRPWGSLSFLERNSRRFHWSYQVSVSIVFTLWVFALLIGIADRKSSAIAFLAPTGAIIMVEFLKRSKDSETYLEIALKGGGFRLFRGKEEEWERPPPPEPTKAELVAFALQRKFLGALLVFWIIFTFMAFVASKIPWAPGVEPISVYIALIILAVLIIRKL